MNKGAEQLIRSLLTSQSLGVLATYDGSLPYCSLVAFAAAEDMKSLVFATMRDTRKYANLKNGPDISILIDSRTHRLDDFKDAMALTAIGSASEPVGASKTPILEIFLKKHPHLRDFVTDPDCAVMSLNVAKFILVTNFRDVTEILINK